MNFLLIDFEPSNFSSTNFYSLDGTGNNLANPNYGSVQSELLNIAPLDYGDRISSPGGANRPNSRVISNTLAQQDSLIASDRGLTNFSWAFGQFIDHDIILTPEVAGAEVEIAVPTGDPHLDPQGTGRVTIPLDHTAFTPETGTSIENPAQISNQITPWLDGSNIYGSDAERNQYLRANTGGRLKVSGGNLLPFGDNDLENANPARQNPETLFAAGDVRGNENAVLVSIHTLFVREHNRLAQELSVAHPDWTDEQLYQRARQINIAQYQAIVYNEYLPSILGQDALAEYTGYDSTVNPSIDRSFASAGFRIGHTQLSSQIDRLDNEGLEIAAGHLTLAESFFRSTDAVSTEGIDSIVRGLSASTSQNIDLKLIDDVRNLLFTFGPHVSGRDLLAINIERGRINGIDDYNTVRAAYGLPTITSFEEITTNVEVQDSLENLYGDVDNIDLFIGLLAEEHLPGAPLGETFRAIIARQFSALRDGDRLYYENSFTPDEITSIEATTLGKLIQRNTDTTIVQDNVFSLANSGTAADDELQGGLGNDTLIGGGGNDSLRGWQGDDLLEVVAGFNNLVGGTGDDTYRLGVNAAGIIDDAAGLDRLVIVDGDREIELTLAQPQVGTVGLAQVGNDLVLDVNQDGAINELQDRKIIDFFNGKEVGIGAIESVGNLSSTEIVNYFISNPSQPLIHTFSRTDMKTYFHTVSEAERDTVMAELPHFVYEGESFYGAENSVTGDALSGAKPVYRFFNHNTGAHFYTISEIERDFVRDNLNNYDFEGIAYHAYDNSQSNTTEVYRLYHQRDDFHLYTTSISERDALLADESWFRSEGDGGVAFYVQPLTQ
ncbi:MAG: peroxidase family protein [Cyanobacteria bacterium J06623_7]